MAGDSIRLLNYTLALFIKSLSTEALSDFVEENYRDLAERDSFIVYQAEGDVSEYIERSYDLKDDTVLIDLKRSLVWSLCMDKREVFYYGSPSEAAPNTNWNDLETNLTHFPNRYNEILYYILDIDTAKELLKSEKEIISLFPNSRERNSGRDRWT